MHDINNNYASLYGVEDYFENLNHILKFCWAVGKQLILPIQYDTYMSEQTIEWRHTLNNTHVYGKPVFHNLMTVADFLNTAIDYVLHREWSRAIAIIFAHVYPWLLFTEHSKSSAHCLK